ncbi:GH3 auxin-responsive promoter family protein [Brumimicrobium mesophilum]|uniref:GH3 auxin-responsive promoter family protein n=1 Tax=Brumimicrobium mesophilum TaxID=392717 RepID=UPI000D142732|nr:GH3 auxin-responsive promoter family protein [Brumimicrobium mesophilum]
MPFNAIFGWLIKKRIHQIDLFRMHPVEVQKEWFERLILTGRKTVFGKRYNFDDINHYDDFRSNIPLQDYENVKEWVEREVSGEEDVLWPGETQWFAKSSGTTSDRSKFIPVTKDSLEECHYKGGKDLLAIYYSHFPYTKLYKGKHLVVGGTAEQNKLRPDRYTGDLSSIILKNLPWWVEIKRIPSRETALMSEWEEKIEKLAEETMYEDVSSISGVPSWTLVLLNRILEKTGKSDIREVWPNLELFMHGGVSFSPYEKEFKRIIPHEDMHYIESYNASEGFFGIQDELNGDLLLMLDYGIFFEFIPMSEYKGTQSEKVISLSEVELDTNYAMVISTNGGLWRYILGDTVQFSSLKPYRVKVTGRTKHFINVFGEEVIVDNADKAIKVACERTNSLLKDYTACPIYMEKDKKGGHEWLIEFSKEPEDMFVFSQILDNTLRELNSDYDAKRTMNLTLDFPLVHQARNGLFDEWLKKKGKLGGQHKVPRLSNDRIILEDILSLNPSIVFEANKV